MDFDPSQAAPPAAPAPVDDAILGNAASVMQGAADTLGVKIDGARYREAAEALARKIGPAALANLSPALVPMAAAFLQGEDFKPFVQAATPQSEAPPHVRQVLGFQDGRKPAMALPTRQSYIPLNQAPIAGAPRPAVPAAATPTRTPNGMPVPAVASDAPPWRASGWNQGRRFRR